LEICQRKNFENQSTFAEVTTKSLFSVCMKVAAVVSTLQV